MATFSQLTGIYLDHELRSADSTVLFTSTRREQATNDGYAEFCELTECLIRVSSVACSCNVSEYNLLSSGVLGSTDFVRVADRGVEYHLTDSNSDLTQLAGDDFPRRDIEWLNKYEPGWRQSTTPQMPVSYYLDERGGAYRIGLYGIPDVGSSDTAKLLIPCVIRPVPMSASTEVPFAVDGTPRTDLYPFHLALPHYAAYQLEKLRGDEQASDRQYQKFLSFVTRFTEKTRKRGGVFVTLAKNYLKDARRNNDGIQDPYRWP